MFRFSLKVGVAAGAVYYLNKEGIWKESTESLKALDKLNTFLSPYVQEVQKQVPFDMPKIPTGANSIQTFQIYWNSGITSSFQFLTELPGKCNKWAQDGITAIMQNPDMEKLFVASGESTDVKK